MGIAGKTVLMRAVTVLGDEPRSTSEWTDLGPEVGATGRDAETRKQFHSLYYYD